MWLALISFGRKLINCPRNFCDAEGLRYRLRNALQTHRVYTYPGPCTRSETENLPEDHPKTCKMSENTKGRPETL
jgi:hypothetical protein